MEELTKTQSVLLTLLVSFVTSIATGIVTVALVDQSSQGVGQTIQTVIQRTIETVAPAATVADPKPKPTTAPPTESDLIVQAVSRNSAALVRINRLNVPAEQAFAALGIIIDKKGTILTDHGLLSSGGNFMAVFADGKEATLTPSTIGTSTPNIALFTFTPSGNVSVVSFGNSDNLSLGQKIISLSGANNDVVQVGVVSSFGNGVSTNTKAFVNTDIDTTNKPFGTIFINLSGEVVGMKTAASVAGADSFQGINDLKSEIK